MEFIGALVMDKHVRMGRQDAESIPFARKNLKIQKLDVATTFISLASFFAMLMALGSVLVFQDTPDIVGIIYSIAAMLMIFALLTYIFIKSHQKLHRYAPAIGYLEEADRIVKKQFAALTLPKEANNLLESDNDSVDDILSIAATTFTMVTGKRCFCSVKEFIQVNGVNSIRVIATDPLSHQRELPLGSAFPVDAFSSLTDILLGKNTARVSINNNLCKGWCDKNYESPLFDIYGQPKVTRRWFNTQDIEWPLPHKSSLVVPISHILKSNISYEGHADDKIVQQGTETSHIWGFLCFHCESTNVFDRRYAPQLARAFSDLLYILLNLSSLHSNLDKLRSDG